MSAELDFKLKAKGESIKTAPTVLSFSTSLTRELANELNLDTSYEKPKDDEYQGYTVVDAKLLYQFINYFEEESEKNRKLIDEYQKDVNDLKEMIPKATSKENYERMREDLFETQSSINYTKEEKESLDHYLSIFKYLKDLLEYDNTDFELVYYCYY